jgi:hypothetical protein
MGRFWFSVCTVACTVPYRLLQEYNFGCTGTNTVLIFCMSLEIERLSVLTSLIMHNVIKRLNVLMSLRWKNFT